MGDDGSRGGQGKIHACNRTWNSRDWDVLVLASDDMVPVKAGMGRIRHRRL